MKLETLEYKKLARMSHLGGELRHRLPKLAGKLLDTFGERLRKLANLTASLASARGRVGARARGKQMARATLRSDLVAIGRTARAIALDRPELDARRFRTPPNGEQRLLATARSVAAPQGSPQNRPTKVTSKPANEGGPGPGCFTATCRDRASLF